MSRIVIFFIIVIKGFVFWEEDLSSRIYSDLIVTVLFVGLVWLIILIKFNRSEWYLLIISILIWDTHMTIYLECFSLNSINVITMYIQIFQVNSTYSQLDDYIWRIRHENVIKNIKMLFINMYMYKIHQ